jgi:hypothetical protein
MEVLLEFVFSNGPLRGYISRPTELNLVSTVQCSGVSWLVSELKDCCGEAGR